MSRIRRRHFLQLAGSSLAAIGLSQVDFLRQGNQMHRALAQDTSRKLALLVGINGYEQSPLRGCVNDVRLQYELLVHRYGFNPQDIVIVTDSASASGLTWADSEVLAGATRTQIIETFREHLGQAQPGDVALFHYSGHGAYVSDPYPIPYDTSPGYMDIAGYEGFKGFDGTLVPTDSRTNDPGKVNDIMGSTLFLLSRAIDTDNFTMVLDSCHAGGGVRGNLIYRSVSRELGEGRHPSDEELTLQASLRERAGLANDNDFIAARAAGIAKGVAMGSARANQLAAERSYSGFQTGIFTYLLTRYLWQAGTARSLEAMFEDLARITRAVDQGNNQDPIPFVQPGTALDQEPPYMLDPDTVAAEAVISKIGPDQSLQLWLGGMTPNAISAENSIYEVLDQQGHAIARVQQDSGVYDGLTADAHFIDTEGNRTEAPAGVSPGSLLQEEIRGLNTDFKLNVGLHESLGDDLENARQGLARHHFITPVTANGDTDTDVLLGRFDAAVRTDVNALGAGRVDVNTLDEGVLGIFENNLTPLLDTFGRSRNESLGSAVFRLESRFRLLLAKKILETLVNTGVTSLPVTLEVGSQERGGLGVVSSGDRTPAGAVLPVLTPGELLSLTVTHQADQSLYVAVIGVENNGNLHIYHPSDWNAPELESELAPGEPLLIHNNLPLEIFGPSGFFDVLVLASREQLRDSLRLLKRTVDRDRGDNYDGERSAIPFTASTETTRSTEDSALNVFGALVDDMTRAGASASTRDTSLDHDAVVAFTATIEVVE
jgi:hypothetical protein